MGPCHREGGKKTRAMGRGQVGRPKEVRQTCGCFCSATQEAAEQLLVAPLRAFHPNTWKGVLVFLRVCSGNPERLTSRTGHGGGNDCSQPRHPCSTQGTQVPVEPYSDVGLLVSRGISEINKKSF